VSEATVGASISDDEGQRGLVYIQRFAYRDGCTEAVIDGMGGEGFPGSGPEWSTRLPRPTPPNCRVPTPRVPCLGGSPGDPGSAGGACRPRPRARPRARASARRARPGRDAM